MPRSGLRALPLGLNAHMRTGSGTYLDPDIKRGLEALDRQFAAHAARQQQHPQPEAVGISRKDAA